MAIPPGFVTAAEIARQLGIPKRTVDWRIARMGLKPTLRPLYNHTDERVRKTSIRRVIYSAEQAAQIIAEIRVSWLPRKRGGNA